MEKALGGCLVNEKVRLGNNRTVFAKDTSQRDLQAC